MDVVGVENVAETILKPCTCGNRTSSEQPAMKRLQEFESEYIAMLLSQCRSIRKVCILCHVHR